MKVLGMKNIEQVVHTCFDGQGLVNHVQTAIEEGDQDRYSLIFTDCSMPIMDGYEASRKVKQIYQNYHEKPYIIAVTGHVEQEYLTNAYKNGIDVIFPKPLPILELGKLLKKYQFIDQIPPNILSLDDDHDEQY